MKQEYLLIGTVLKPQGIRGEVKIKSYAANIESFLKWKRFFRLSGGSYLPVAIRPVRIQDSFVYAVPDQCASANDAEKYRGYDLYIPHADAADPDSRSGSLIADLIGCRAVSENGEEIGVLKDVLQHGPVDIWVFATPKGNLMVPALLSVFPEVDTAKGIIAVCGDRLTEVAVYED